MERPLFDPDHAFEPDYLYMRILEVRQDSFILCFYFSCFFYCLYSFSKSLAIVFS